jgi:hypothetical protein
MPVTAVNEYNCAILWQDNIGAPGKVRPLQPKSEATSVHGSTNRYLRGCVSGPHLGHKVVFGGRWSHVCWNGGALHVPRRFTYRPPRNRSTAAISPRLMPGSSAECPASGTIVIRALCQAAARSNAVTAGQIMS